MFFSRYLNQEESNYSDTEREYLSYGPYSSYVRILCKKVFSSFVLTFLTLVVNDNGTIRKNYEMDPTTGGVFHLGKVKYWKFECRSRSAVTLPKKW